MMKLGVMKSVVVLLVAAACDCASALAPLRLESMRTLRAGRDGQSLLRIHDGNDWSQQSGTQTGETVKYAYMLSSAFVRTAAETIRTNWIRFDVHPL